MEAYVLIMTYLCMVSRHSSIEGWYMVKSYVHEHGVMTTQWLAGMDSAFLFSYAIGNIISGYLEDRLPLRILIAVGLALSGFIYSVIIAMGYSNAYIPYIFLIQWALQGLSQSTVWPGTIAVLGNWFKQKHRGKILGFWSSCGSVGNVVGAVIGGLILTMNQEWMVVTMTFAAFQILVAIIYIFTISDKPPTGSKVLVEDYNENSQVSINLYELSSHLISTQHKIGMPFLQAIRLPGVIAFSLSFACVKSLYYGLSMWLPFFLRNRIDHPELIGILAGSLNVGAVIGSIVCGWLGDVIKFRSPVITLYLLLSLPLLLLLEVGNESIYWLYFIVIPLVGFFIGGGGNIMASAVAADLSQNPDIAEKSEATATVVGIIDGAGGIGAAFATFIMGYLSQIDWLYVFLFMLFMAILAILLISRLTLQDLRRIKQNRIRKKIEIT